MVFKTVEELQKLGKTQMDAATASAAAVSRGLQQIAAETSAFARRSVEDGSAATTRLLGARSLDGAVEAQVDYARTAFGRLMAQAGRMGSLMMAVGTEAARPFDGVAPFGGRSSSEPSRRGAAAGRPGTAHPGHR